MAVELKEQDEGKLLEIHVSGRLNRDDYQHFVPEVDRLIQKYGKVRILFVMSDFHGWNAGAMWEDTKFAFKHYRDIERLAVIGEKKWQKSMTTFCKPFTKAAIRYFTRDQAESAQAWLHEQLVNV